MLNSILPYDTITITGDYSTGSAPENFILISNDITPQKTILAIKLQQSGLASETIIYCGNNIIAHNFAKDYSLDLINYVCNNQDVILTKSGNDTAFLSLSYVPYDVSKISTSTPTYYNGFSGGEIINSTFNFLFLIFLMFFAFKLFTSGLKVYNKEYDV